MVARKPENDLAVVRVDEGGLVPAILRPARELRPGHAVFAIGNPFGQQGAVTAGIIVATPRPVEVVRAKMRTMDSLQLQDTIEDILITLGTQYHLIRLVRSQRGQGLFFYIALSKAQANLAMARRELQVIERDLQL